MYRVYKNVLGVDNLMEGMILSKTIQLRRNSQSLLIQHTRKFVRIIQNLSIKVIIVSGALGNYQKKIKYTNSIVELYDLC